MLWVFPSVVNLPVTQLALDCIMVTYKTTINYSRLSIILGNKVRDKTML